MDRLFACWRLNKPAGQAADGKPHANLEPAEGKTLFQTLLESDLPESETYILGKYEKTFAILNVFPYTVGHVLVLPNRPVATIGELDDSEYLELFETVRQARAAVNSAFAPDGLNIGINEGTAGGGSIPDHLHVHVVPRWNSDTNFMTALAETRLLPIPLSEAWERISSHWPR